VTGKTILGIVALCVCGLIILFVARPALVVPNQKATLYVAESVCKQVGVCLKIYYEKLDVRQGEIRRSDVVEFLLNECGVFSFLFSTDPPFAPYESAFDFSVYLLLPDSLEHASPVLVGYTSRIKRAKGRLFRIGLFLRGEDAIAVPFRHHVLEEIVGEEVIRRAKPDFYYWHSRPKELLETKTVQ